MKTNSYFVEPNVFIYKIYENNGIVEENENSDLIIFLNELNELLDFISKEQILLNIDSRLMAELYKKYPDIPYGRLTKHNELIEALKQNMLLRLSSITTNSNQLCVLNGCTLNAEFEEKVTSESMGYVDFYESILHSCDKLKNQYQPNVIISKSNSRIKYNLVCCNSYCGKTANILINSYTCDDLIQLINKTKYATCVDQFYNANINNYLNHVFDSREYFKSYRDFNIIQKKYIVKRKFIQSLKKHSEIKILESLAKALTKKAYGIEDKGLGDEQVAGEEYRRLRVGEFWRVHYCDIGESLELVEFGEHNIGIGG